MPRVYPLSRATTQRICSEPQLKEHSNKSIFKAPLKPCRSRISKHTIVLPLHYRWRCFRVVRQNSVLDRLAELRSHSLCRYRLAERLPPPGATRSSTPLIWQLSPGGSNPTARRYTSTCVILGFFFTRRTYYTSQSRHQDP